MNDLLEISENASDEEIKKAFKKKLLYWHPDKSTGATAELKMKKFDEIYETYKKWLNDKKSS